MQQAVVETELRAALNAWYSFPDREASNELVDW